MELGTETAIKASQQGKGESFSFACGEFQNVDKQRSVVPDS